MINGIAAPANNRLQRTVMDKGCSSCVLTVPSAQSDAAM
jgi:hypothetical protein